MARVVVVSNRVAVPNRDGGARAGGLEVVLRSFLKRNQGVWFGWSGRTVPKGEETVRAGRAFRRHLHHHRHLARATSRNITTASPTGCCGRSCITGSISWSSPAATWPAISASTRCSPTGCRALLQARRRDLGARLSFPAARQGAARARRREQDRLLPAYSVSAAGYAHRAAQARAHHPQPLPLRSGRIPDRQRRQQFRGLPHRRMPDAEPRPPHLHRRHPHDADRRVPGRRRDGGVRAAGAARQQARSRARGGAQPCRPQHDHRRRSARLFQGHRACGCARSSSSSPTIRAGAAP